MIPVYLHSYIAAFGFIIQVVYKEEEELIS